MTTLYVHDYMYRLHVLYVTTCTVHDYMYKLYMTIIMYITACTRLHVQQYMYRLHVHVHNYMYMYITTCTHVQGFSISHTDLVVLVTWRILIMYLLTIT